MSDEEVVITPENVEEVIFPPDPPIDNDPPAEVVPEEPPVYSHSIEMPDGNIYHEYENPESPGVFFGVRGNPDPPEGTEIVQIQRQGD